MWKMLLHLHVNQNLMMMMMMDDEGLGQVYNCPKGTLFNWHLVTLAVIGNYIFQASPYWQSFLSSVIEKPIYAKTNEPRHVISNNVVDSDKPQQPILSLETPNDVQSVA